MDSSQVLNAMSSQLAAVAAALEALRVQGSEQATQNETAAKHQAQTPFLPRLGNGWTNTINRHFSESSTNQFSQPPYQTTGTQQ